MASEVTPLQRDTQAADGRVDGHRHRAIESIDDRAAEITRQQRRRDDIACRIAPDESAYVGRAAVGALPQNIFDEGIFYIAVQIDLIPVEVSL